MRKWLWDHSLGLTAIGITLSFLTISWFTRGDIPLREWVYDQSSGSGHDSLGVVLIIYLTKVFIERGSKESKE